MLWSRWSSTSKFFHFISAHIHTVRTTPKSFCRKFGNMPNIACCVVCPCTVGPRCVEYMKPNTVVHASIFRPAKCVSFIALAIIVMLDDLKAEWNRKRKVLFVVYMYVCFWKVYVSWKWPAHNTQTFIHSPPAQINRSFQFKSIVDNMANRGSKTPSYRQVTTPKKQVATTIKREEPSAKPCSAAKAAPKKEHVVYSLNLEGGRKYVGKTDNFDQRMKQHFSGNGSQWTQKHAPVSINHVQVCRTAASQAKAETIVYTKMRDYHGSDVVRGAGYTKST